MPLWKCTKCGVYQDNPGELVASSDPGAELFIKTCRICYSPVEKVTQVETKLRMSEK